MINAPQPHQRATHQAARIFSSLPSKATPEALESLPCPCPSFPSQPSLPSFSSESPLLAPSSLRRPRLRLGARRQTWLLARPPLRVLLPPRIQRPLQPLHVCFPSWRFCVREEKLLRIITKRRTFREGVRGRNQGHHTL